MADLTTRLAQTHAAPRRLRTPRSRYWKDFVKLCWTSLGAHLPDSTLDRARIWLDYLCTARWLKTQDLSPKSRVQGGREVFRAVAEPIADKPVTYLEFGVYKGHTMSQWSGLLRHPQSRLIGFDSFEGLPEDWGSHCPKGTFSARGVVPNISDPRITLVKGWFEETVPMFEFPNTQPLVVLLDADLYSSTRLVLKALQRYISVGTTLIFGELNDRDHERRAFEEFLAETGMKFEATVADFNLVYVAFRRVA